MSREVFDYDGLVVGECDALEITISAGQNIKRGDLLIASDDKFVKDTAGATIGKVYCVASEDIETTEGASKSLGYFKGKFAKDKVTEQASVVSEYVLASMGIILVATR